MLSSRTVLPLKASFLVLIMIISACTGNAKNDTSMFTNKTISKSANDTRQYHTLTLDNGMEVMLVSDPEADKGAAALDINAGSGADPQGREGLAHFLEHMLFLGTEKYPEPGEYQEFINRHGGNHNAFTAFEHTNYYFDVDSDYLEPALDRFSQQFVAPLFSNEYVEREKNAVHSEYSAKIRDDSRRFFAVIKQALNPEHPMAKFAVGNLETLSDRPDSKIRDDLLRFYEDHYSAHQMKLVVSGKQSLEQLETWVREKFSDVKRRQVKVVKHPPIFRDDQLPMLVSLRPVKDTRSLSLLFELPSTEPYLHNKPLYYLTNLIGHEGEGSLLSWLKEQQLAEGLSAGLFTSDHDSSVVNISISLTEQGRQQYLSVIRDTLSYIQLMLTNGIEEWRFNEQAAMLDTAFRFQEKTAPIHYVSSIASRLQDYSPFEALEAPYVMDKFDAQLLHKFASRLTTNNMVAVLMAPDAVTDQTERWYETPYSVQKMAAEDISYINRYNAATDMHMPAANQFIPDNLELLPAPSMAKPEVIFETRGYTAWFAKDVSFGTPKSSFYLSVRSPLANDSATSLILTELYVSLAKDALTEYSYPAYLAGLDFKLYRHLRGITLRIEGFSDKQSVLLERILRTLKTLQINPDRFEQNKRDLDRDLRNALQNKPFERLATEARSWLLSPYWTEQEQIQALAAIQQKDLEDFIPQFWDKTNLVTLNHGNATEKQATASSDVITEKLLADTNVVKVDKSQVVNLNKNNWVRQIYSEHQDTAYLYYVQSTKKSFSDRAAFGLLAQIIGPAYYNTIRTEQQMGYVVFATPYTLLEVPALAFIVQSPSHSADQIHNRTIEFLAGFQAKLRQMPEAEFAKHQEAFVTRLTESDKTLEQRSNRFWTEIDTQNTDFDTTARIAKIAESFSRQDLASFMEKHFLNHPQTLLLVATPQTQQRAPLFSEKTSIGERSAWLIHNSLFPAMQR